LLEILKIFVQLPESYIREISTSLSGNIAPRKITGGYLLKLSVAPCKEMEISQLKSKIAILETA